MMYNINVELQISQTTNEQNGQDKKSERTKQEPEAWSYDEVRI